MTFGGEDMQKHKTVSQQEWIELRKELLVKEKEFTAARDQLSLARRELPWVKLEKEYLFDTESGKESLLQLFQGKSQLIVYHFMFHPQWETGCKSCSFWADNYDNIIVHLNQRDVSFVTISRAPLERLLNFKKRMGWDFLWASSLSTDFNQDFHVSFTPQQVANDDTYYNYRKGGFNGEEAHGISVFYKNSDDVVFHTYSCYGRGLDMLNTTYHYLDLVPKGRDEDKLSYPMEWVHLHDSY